MTALDIIIMAAGKGTRMKSRIPKVLQRLAGRPLLHHVLGQAASLQARRVVVVTGHGATEVEAACAGLAGHEGTFDLKFVRQEPQLGTGHAVQQATPALAGDGTVVVLSGDVPLTQAATLRALVEAGAGERLALLTVRLPDPTGYGRIVRGEGGTVQRIVEHKDANDAERAIDEVYSGIMEDANSMFAKVLSISDTLMWDWYTLLSFKSLSEIAALKAEVAAGRNPKDAKVMLAKEITARFHSAALADAAEQDFINRSKGGIPDDIPEVRLAGAPLGIGALLKQANLAPSTSEANRLIDGGGVRVDGGVVSDKGLKLEAGSYVVQVGKRKFARVTLA